MKYLAFDLETAKIVEEGQSLEENRPLGISVAATLKSDGKPRVWYGQGHPQGIPWKRMPMMQVRTLVQHLQQAVNDGYQIVSWNGLRFDFSVLAEESGMKDECIELAMNHLDPMFHFFCLKGFYVGLAKVAEAMAVEGKSGSGKDAPRLWAAGEYQKIKDYVAQDAVVTINVFNAIQRQQEISWITKRGALSSVALASIEPVCEAMKLPLPDTSWMTGTPPNREGFFKWMTAQ